MKPRHCAILLALGTQCAAWIRKANFSDIVQCGTVSVDWAAGNETELIGPPFVVRMAAFGLAPLTITIPESAWNFETRVGSYKFSMPWPEGTQFMTSFDDGYGSATGGISGIQTVGASSNSSCITTSITQPEHIFDLHGTFTQCASISMNWTEPATSKTRIAGLVPNGVAFQVDPPLINARSTTWDQNLLAGTAFVLIYNEGTGRGLTSPLIISGNSSNTNCFANPAYPSATASQTGIAQVRSTLTGPTQTSESAQNSSVSTYARPNLGAILGATLGSLALLAALVLVLCMAIRRRRRQRVVPQSPELAKEMNLNTENTQLGRILDGRDLASNPYRDGAVVLPFVLLSNASKQQDTPSATRRETTSRKQSTTRPPSTDTLSANESSDVNGTRSSPGPSSTMPASGIRLDEFIDNEPVIIRHEDAGAVRLPRVREIIELPPGYDQLPRQSPSSQAPQQLPQQDRQGPGSPGRKLSVSTNM